MHRAFVDSLFALIIPVSTYVVAAKGQLHFFPETMIYETRTNQLTRNMPFVLLLLFSSPFCVSKAGAVPIYRQNQFQLSKQRRPATTFSSLHLVRGGSSSLSESKVTGSDVAKKKIRRKKAKKQIPAKHEINQALHDTDAAQALGQAVRDQASEWRFSSDDEQTLSSMGWALGRSSSRLKAEDNSGIPAAPSAVLAYYFLNTGTNSLGGSYSHGWQCLCSVMASLTGLGALILSLTKQQQHLSSAAPTIQILTRRCLLFAMLKHVSGLLSASWFVAQKLPETGVRQARNLLQKHIIRKPVARYVFYTGLLQGWLRLSDQGLWKHGIIRSASVFAFLFPVLLREVISSLLVVSDVLVLLSLTIPESAGLKFMVDSLPSAVPLPSSKNQTALAKSVSQISFVFELITGSIMVGEVSMAATSFLFGTATRKVSSLIFRLLLVRLYIQFLRTLR